MNSILGTEARRIFDDAQEMLNKICEDGVVQAHGVIGLFPANSDGDDIKVFNEHKSDVISILCGLRQQVKPLLKPFHCIDV